MTHRAPDATTKKPDGSAQSLEDWTRSVDAFSRMIERLQTDYAELERRHALLNTELSDVNESLRATADANRHLAMYLDQIVAGVTLGMIAVDRQGVVRLFNPAAASLLGLAADEVLNQHYLDIWPDRQDDPATALACALGEKQVRHRRREIHRNGNDPVILSVSTVRLDAVVPDPSVSDLVHDGAIEIFSDVSALEAMHQEMARMRTLAALGEMSATVAHEIRNPLGGVIGFAGLLARRSQGNPEQQEMVTKILRGAEHLNTVVERLLDFARSPKIERRPLEWPKFLQTTLDQYEEGAKRRGARITLVRKWKEELPEGRADAICLRQALWNILENAEHATDGKGEIIVSAAKHSDGRLMLSVSDDGKGIDPDVAGRIFSPFVTTKKKGTGLGLATARKLIEAHGGAISLESQPGEGTTVRVELPPTTGEG